ncbi:hypothetical protein ACFLYP_02210 [Chloroflexota bacterium]
MMNNKIATSLFIAVNILLLIVLSFIAFSMFGNTRMAPLAGAAGAVQPVTGSQIEVLTAGVEAKIVQQEELLEEMAELQAEGAPESQITELQFRFQMLQNKIDLDLIKIQILLSIYGSDFVTG